MAAAGIDGDRPSILVVDDDPSVLRGLSRTLRLEALEWNVEFVLGGRAAVARLEARHFDVVITDYHMPCVRGDLVLAAAATLQPDALRFLLTASDVRIDEVHAHQVVAKPFEPAALRALLRQIVGSLGRRAS